MFSSQSLGQKNELRSWPQPRINPASTPSVIVKPEATEALLQNDSSLQVTPFSPKTLPFEDVTTSISKDVSPAKKEHLIVDAGVFIRLKQLHAFDYETVHVTTGVAAEIRDRAARQNLNLLVNVPKISQPSEKDIAFVKRFAKQTGDLGFLSENDIELIALTYMLQRLTGDIESLNSKPPSDVKTEENSNDSSLFTWGLGKKETKKQEERIHVERHIEQSKNAESGETEDDARQCHDSDDDSDGTWICEANSHEFRLRQHAQLDPVIVEQEAVKRLRVACLTTDFSVQNVLLQMGLSVLSIDGMKISSAKRWALLCRGCRKVMTDTTKKFCSHCGNDTLRRVAMNIDFNGRVSIDLPKHAVSTRGKVYPIPKPKGGRHGDLILCEDQMFIGGRDHSLRQQQKAWEKQKSLRDPFNLDNVYEQRGWHYRTQEVPFKGLQIGMGPGNPNSKRFHLKNKRK